MALLLWHTQLLTAHADEECATPVAEQSVVADVAEPTEAKCRAVVARNKVIFNEDSTAATNDESAATANQSVVSDQVIIDEGDQVAESSAALSNAVSVTANEESPVSLSEVEGAESAHGQSILTHEEMATDSLVNGDAELLIAEPVTVIRPNEIGPMVNQPALASSEQNLPHDDDVVNQYRSAAQAMAHDVTKDDEDAMSGNFGVDWHFDASTGTLTLSGGTLNNSYGDNPWRRKSWAPMITRIVIADRIIAGSNMNSLFADLVSVTRYEGLERLDTSAVTNMQSVFKENSALEKLDLSAWNVGNVSTMVNMFMGSFMGTELTYLNLSGWDTRNVTNMQNMFQYNDQLRIIDGLTDWDTRRVTTMTNMFARSGVGHLNLANFDSASLLEMDGAFSQMPNLEGIEFGARFTVANVTKMNSLFNNDVKLKSLDLSHFNMQNVKANWQMLAGLTSLQTLTLGPELDFGQHGTQPLVGLPDIPKNGKYTGKWVNMADASQTFTSDELLARYTGNQAETATFVWETKSAAAITGNDSTLFVNQQWDWSQNVTQLVDHNGQAVDPGDLFSTDPQAVTVSGELVDTSKPGTYHVTLTYAGRQTTVVVTVKDNQSQLNLHAHDVTVEIDQATGSAVWQAQDNFDSATDADGRPVDWQNVTVLGEPDLTRPGTYDVVYQFTDLTGQLVTATTTVTVAEAEVTSEDLTTLVVQDTTVTVGSDWQATDNLVSATDATGKSLTLADLVVTGDVDTTKPGTYEVKYQYTNAFGQQWTQTAQITVVADASDGDDGETPLPGEPTEPELPAEPELPSEPETPEVPKVPEVPEVPEIPEVPETPEQPAQPGTSVTDQPDTAGDNGDLTGTHTGAVNQGEPLEIDKRPELTSDLEQTGITGTNDWVQLNTSEHDGYPDQQLAATNQISKQPAMTDEQTDNHVSGQLPQTGERTNQLGLMGLMMLMVTGLAGIVGIKRWRR